jgi:hypothetical protein
MEKTLKLPYKGMRYEIVDCRFRWAFCQYEFLRRCILACIRRALEKLPSTLDETYDGTFEDIDDRNWEFYASSLSMHRRCIAPLTAEELAEFLA